MFENKILLITGGTGSFGHAVLSRMLALNFGEVRIFSRDEKKQDEMRNAIPSDRIKYFIGDVRDFDAVDDALHGVNYVFHAAALKQVPSCEFYPMEAIRTNVLGAENVMRASIARKVERCVVLSTDKAVYPVNAMGMSKALMEKVMAAKARVSGQSGTVLCATRYGNVMASRGSVIPLFLDQITKGKQLTVTDPNMTRFLMSLDESVDLVLYAFAHAQPGDIFVQKAPASTIGDLAQAMQEMFGVDQPLSIIGTRHGEKLYECLVSREEMVTAKDLGDYYRLPSDNRDLNYDKYFVEGEPNLDMSREYNSHNTRRLNIPEIKDLLLKLEIVRNAV